MCRCLSHLIRAEALEQQFLPVSQQKYYRNSLHETFKEVKMGIEMLPIDAVLEAMQELLGLVESDVPNKFEKLDDCGIQIDKMFQDRFVLSLFGTFVKKITNFMKSDLRHNSPHLGFMQ